MSYCDYCLTKEKGDLHKQYHDLRYGFPIESDDELFGRLILEINQAGLSWDTILKKEKNFIEAFDHYSIDAIAKYDDNKIGELLGNAGIIRNKLKISAVIHNALVLKEIQNEYGSFRNWLDSHHPKTIEEWTKLFRKTFKFVGGEIVKEFLMSTGYLKGAHTENCEVFHKIKEQEPKWLQQ